MTKEIKRETVDMREYIQGNDDNGGAISSIALAEQDITPVRPENTVNKQAGFVSFGKDNMFPNDIVGITGKSPINSAIIESAVTYICGKGVRNSGDDPNRYVGAPNSRETWDEVIKKIAVDYRFFGGFYVQVIVNKDSTTVSVFHHDFTEVRIGEIDKYGNPKNFRIAADWTKTTGKNKPATVERWPGIDKAAKGRAYLLEYYDYLPGLKYYCLPTYFPSIEYVKADGALGMFYNNSINNGFTPSAIFTFTSNPDEETKKKHDIATKKAFCGTKGANNFITFWGESKDVKATVLPFSASNNADVYNNVESIVFQKIISAHRLSSPTLAGVSGGGNLSGNASEIIDAFVLYNYTVIEGYRAAILDRLNEFTKINRVDLLTIDELDVVKKIKEKEGDTPTGVKARKFFKKWLSWK